METIHPIKRTLRTSIFGIVPAGDGTVKSIASPAGTEMSSGNSGEIGYNPGMTVEQLKECSTRCALRSLN